jgi:hypothetical protein
MHPSSGTPTTQWQANVKKGRDNNHSISATLLTIHRNAFPNHDPMFNNRNNNPNHNHHHNKSLLAEEE